MADSGKRKAKVGDLGAGPSSWRLAAEESDGGEDFELAAGDPLLVLGSEIMTMILGKVDVRSAAVARLVSRGWQAVASSDRIWAPKWKSFILEFGYCQPGGVSANANWRKAGSRNMLFFEHVNGPDSSLS